MTGAVSLGFMKRDMDSTAQHVAAETSQEAATGTTTLQARPAGPARGGGGFKHHLLQVLGAALH